MYNDTQPYPENIIGIPLTGGITEGGLIIIGILIIVISVITLGIAIIWKFGNEIRHGLNAVKCETSSANKQVTNSNTTNLRDDLDAKHIVTEDKLDALAEQIGNRFDRMNDRITSVDRRLSNIDNRINKLGE